MDWMVRYIPIMILVLLTLFVVFQVLTFDWQGAGTDIGLGGHVSQIDAWCEREVGERTMSFDLPEQVESVVIDGGTTYRATLEGGSLVTVDAESCSRVRICQEGDSGRMCGKGGALPGGSFEADMYFDGDEVIIDPRN